MGVHNPTVDFHFAGLPTINSITIYLDNSQTGGVGTPDQILVDGVFQPSRDRPAARSAR